MCILTDLAPVRAAIGDDESSDIFGKSASSASSLGANSTGTSEGVDSAFGSGDPPPSLFTPSRSAEGLLLQYTCLSSALWVFFQYCLLLPLVWTQPLAQVPPHFYTQQICSVQLCCVSKVELQIC